MLQKIHNYFLFSDVTKMQTNHMYIIDYYFILIYKQYNKTELSRFMFPLGVLHC